MDALGEMFKRFSKTFAQGSIIFCEFEPGDNFYLIQSGRVQIVKIMGEIEKTLDVLKPGEVFGEMAILEEAPRSATAIAMDKVQVLEFNRANFEILMRGNPQIALKLLKLFTRRIYDQKRRFMILTLEDVEARVADVFLMLAEKEPIALNEVDSIEFKSSIDDIAHWAGIQPAQAKTVLAHFLQQRRIELYADRIVVKNINDFARFVASRRKTKE
jgi:CRP/FNR family cyclic AMP-dependent transcriptional regulator